MEHLDSWITPIDQFFVIKHYNGPTLAEEDYRLEIGGLVDNPAALTLADLKARVRQEVTFWESNGRRHAANPDNVMGQRRRHTLHL